MAKTIIFDMGGVLVNLDWDKVCAGLERHSSLDPGLVRAAAVNGPVVAASMKGEMGAAEFYETFSAQLGLDIDYAGFTEIWNGLLTPNEAVYPLVEELRGKHPLVLASNTDPFHYARALEICPVMPLFDRRFLSYEMGLAKPDPEFFRRLLADLDRPAARCVFIDDSPRNVEAARALGIAAFPYRDAATLRRDLGLA